MTIDDYIEDLEAGPDHEIAELYVRSHKGCSLNDLLQFMERVVEFRNEKQVR